MKNIKKIACLFIITAVACYSLPIQALTKDETVYGMLKNDGTVKSIIVNEHLISDSEEEIKDETDLLNILNINGKENFKIDGTKITWENKGNDIYYKGTSNKELPIKINIKYYQDNEEKELNNIIGKKGNFKIKITYTNTDLHRVLINGKYEELYTPFLISTGLIIKGDNNKSVIVNNGKVINNGKDNIVIGLSSPGLYESLKLEALNLNYQLYIL